jgi:hypothetical protein
MMGEEKILRKCNAYIEELCSKFDEVELNGDCRICGIKIAFHERKISKQVIQNITNYYGSDNLSKNNQSSSKIIESKDIFNLPVYLLKIFCSKWIQIEDISRVDRAVCESTKRKILLEVLNGITAPGLKFTFFKPDYDDDDDDEIDVADDYERYNLAVDSYLPWLSKRNIFIKSFILTRFDEVLKFYYSFSNIEYLIIDFKHSAEKFNDLIFKILLKYCIHLTEVSIVNCQEIADTNVFSTVAYFNKLSIKNCEYFDADCSANLNNESTTALSTITNVTFTNLPNITDYGFSSFCKKFENLKVLIIENGENFSNDCLISISKYCKNLEILELYKLKNITDDGLLAYKEGFFKLKKFDICGCRNVNDESSDENKIFNNETYYYY